MLAVHAEPGKPTRFNLSDRLAGPSRAGAPGTNSRHNDRSHLFLKSPCGIRPGSGMMSPRRCLGRLYHGPDEGRAAEGSFRPNQVDVGSRFAFRRSQGQRNKATA